ncbi:hypothetical protein L218DRAFT_953391 [Marasmius fiardii PR-910]|nr:hypothetical protein L218DRAFT_953391 [Marasmius fiardii PR-910]
MRIYVSSSPSFLYLPYVDLYIPVFAWASPNDTPKCVLVFLLVYDEITYLLNVG